MQYSLGFICEILYCFLSFLIMSIVLYCAVYYQAGMALLEKTEKLFSSLWSVKPVRVGLISLSLLFPSNIKGRPEHQGPCKWVLIGGRQDQMYLLCCRWVTDWIMLKTPRGQWSLEYFSWSRPWCWTRIKASWSQSAGQCSECHTAGEREKESALGSFTWTYCWVLSTGVLSCNLSLSGQFNSNSSFLVLKSILCRLSVSWLSGFFLV